MTEPTDETLARYIEKFGPKDGPIIRNITFKAATLAWRWRVFLYFFCGPRERVDVLNEASGIMAKLLYDILWDDALLRVRQLTDHANQRKGENLSLPQLVRIANENGFDVSDSYQTVELACKLARAYADKQIAHSDVAHALGDAQSNVTRAQTTDAIRAICLFVREFLNKGLNSDFELMPITDYANEQQFLLRLYQGNQADKAFEAAALTAALAGDWPVLNRADIPRWLREEDELTDLF